MSILENFGLGLVVMASFAPEPRLEHPKPTIQHPRQARK